MTYKKMGFPEKKRIAIKKVAYSLFFSILKHHKELTLSDLSLLFYSTNRKDYKHSTGRKTLSKHLKLSTWTLTQAAVKLKKFNFISTATTKFTENNQIKSLRTIHMNKDLDYIKPESKEEKSFYFKIANDTIDKAFKQLTKNELMVMLTLFKHHNRKLNHVQLSAGKIASLLNLKNSDVRFYLKSLVDKSWIQKKPTLKPTETPCYISSYFNPEKLEDNKNLASSVAEDLEHQLEIIK